MLFKKQAIQLTLPADAQSYVIELEYLRDNNIYCIYVTLKAHIDYFKLIYMYMYSSTQHVCVINVNIQNKLQYGKFHSLGS